jgi:hypothetical protein
MKPSQRALLLLFLLPAARRPLFFLAAFDTTPSIPYIFHVLPDSHSARTLFETAEACARKI